MRHIVICALPGSRIFFHSLINSMIFLKKKVIEHKTRVLFFSANFVRNTSHLKEFSETFL